MPTISMTSGAIQYGVPTTGSLMAVSRVSSIRVATPKSASLTIPCLVVRMLAPLMSRCTTPSWCRYASPRSTCAM